ncbi:MAG: 16S rRNA (guanine(966)-N(2))-methyltransferase RsmD [Pseudomonadota bacterium]
MRIIGGSARGLHLTPVGAGDAAAHLRPTSDRVREAIFNLLINGGYGNPVAGARVLDLFAGTGALGLEALSRGAAHATFVDDGRAAHALITRNITLLRSPDTTVLKRDATTLPPNPAPAYTLVFLDPPYGKSMGQAALASLTRGNWLAPGAVLVWEEGSPQIPPPPFDQLDQRKYGDTIVTLLKAPI